MEEKVFDGTTSVPNRPEDGCIALINGLILILMVLTQVFGDLWLSHGMKAFGAVQSLTPHAVFNLPTTALTYAVSFLGARYVLHEQVVPGRLVIGLGVFRVALT